MNFFGDRDGKTKTSSAVDAEHYPDMDGVGDEAETIGVSTQDPPSDGAFSHTEVQKLAYELWETAGRPAGSHEQDWHEAEQRVLEAHRNRTDSQTMAAQAGSVQR
jgi:hypothetical protein